MPEAPGLYLRLTVAENLEFFAGLYELADVRGRIEQALRAVNLADRADDPCGSLSKGLEQRVALARALLSDPRVLFLDEPTSGLDPVAAREVHELIDALRERGVTIFLTTHRLEEAERLCDRVAILNTTLRTDRPSRRAARAACSRTIAGRDPVRTPLDDPERVFARRARRRWLGARRHRRLRADGLRPARSRRPRSTRALVAAGADVLSIAESQPLARRRLPGADRRGRGGEEPMSFSWTRVGAIVRKELRDYRRNRFVRRHDGDPAGAVHRRCR